MNSKLAVMNKGGTGCTVYYDGAWIVIELLTRGATQSSGQDSNALILPTGITPTRDVYISVNVMTAGWIPSDITAYIVFSNGKRNATMRFTNSRSISNAVILGTFAFPRSFFTIS